MRDLNTEKQTVSNVLEHHECERRWMEICVTAWLEPGTSYLLGNILTVPPQRAYGFRDCNHCVMSRAVAITPKSPSKWNINVKIGNKFGIILITEC